MEFVDFIKMWIDKSIIAEKSGHTIFVSYEAHMKMLRIRIFINGWKTGADPDIDFNFYAW